jgi:hypothetical protein
MLKRRTRLSALLASVVLALTMLAASAQSASAYTYGNVWINFAPSLCPHGGSVVRIYWSVDSVSSGPSNGDRGDNVIYPRVRVGSGSYNTLSFKLWCKRFFIEYMAGEGQKHLSPYKSGLSYTYYTYY